MQKSFFRYLMIFSTVLALNLSPAFNRAALGADAIKFALPGNSMGYLPLFVAVHRGFFKDEGLDIELPRLIPAMAQNALLAGEVHYHGLADSGLRLAARGLPSESDILRRRPADVLSGGAEGDSHGGRASRQADRRQPIRRHV